MSKNSVQATSSLNCGMMEQCRAQTKEGTPPTSGVLLSFLSSKAGRKKDLCAQRTLTCCGRCSLCPQGAPSLVGETVMGELGVQPQPCLSPVLHAAKVSSTARRSWPRSSVGHRWLGARPCLCSTEPEVELALEMNGRVSHQRRAVRTNTDPNLAELCILSR